MFRRIKIRNFDIMLKNIKFIGWKLRVKKKTYNYY